MPPALPLYTHKKHTGTKAAVVTGEVVIYAAYVTANGANMDVNLIDALTDGGEDDLDINVLDGDCKMIHFPGGIIFNTGLSITIAGTGQVHLWTDRAQATA
jgi:hypothetical protein